MATHIQNGWTRGTGDDIGIYADRVLFVEKSNGIYTIVVDEDNDSVLRFSCIDHSGDTSETFVVLEKGSVVEYQQIFKLLAKGGIKLLPNTKYLVWLYTGKLF